MDICGTVRERFFGVLGCGRGEVEAKVIMCKSIHRCIVSECRAGMKPDE
jgi:hypothetical protein